MAGIPRTTVEEPLVHWPELGVCRVPYQVFMDQALYDLEQQRIFRGDAWHWVGLEAETPNRVISRRTTSAIRLSS